MEDQTIILNLTSKLSLEENKVEAKLLWTIGQLKSACSNKTNIPIDEIRLVYKGKSLEKSLKGDIILQTLGIADGDSIHIVRNPSNPKLTPQSNQASLMADNFFADFLRPMPDMREYEKWVGKDPQMMQQFIMTNPQSQSIMMPILSNPQNFESFLNQNPILKQRVDSNPQIREMLKNPANIQSVFSWLRDGMMLFSEGMEASQPILSQPQQNQPSYQTKPTNISQPEIMPGGEMEEYEMPCDEDYQSATQQNLNGVYAAQIMQIKEKGFNDEKLIIQALQIAGGNVEAAIEELINSR